MYSTRSSFRMPALGGFIEDVFHNGFPSVFGDENRADVPVNIVKTENAYDLQLVAPGLKKEDFKISVDNDVLHISYEHKEEKETAGKWIRKEHTLRTFHRSFTLNDKVDVAGISAKYNEGILTLSLPKKAASESGKQEISVA